MYDISRTSTEDFPECLPLCCECETHTRRKLGVPAWRLFLYLQDHWGLVAAPSTPILFSQELFPQIFCGQKESWFHLVFATAPCRVSSVSDWPGLWDKLVAGLGAPGLTLQLPGPKFRALRPTAQLPREPQLLLKVGYKNLV